MGKREWKVVRTKVIVRERVELTVERAESGHEAEEGEEREN